MNYVSIIVNGVQLDGVNNFGNLLALSYAISDFQDLSKRKGAGSKTITVPRTKKNDAAFGLAYNSTVVTSTNKSSSLDCIIRHNGVPVLSGKAKLLEASRDTIEFQAVAGNASVKELLGNLTLQDLNLSDIDHEYSNTVAFDTWDGTYPAGMPEDFFYPFVDYGAFTNLQADVVAPGRQADSFYPAIKVKRLINQIFIDAGLSLNSTFFDKVEMGRLFEIFSNKELAHSPAWVEDQTYKVNLGAPQSINSVPYVKVALNTIVTDPGGNYNSATWEYTCAEAVRMNVYFTCEVSGFTSNGDIAIKQDGVTVASINIISNGTKTGLFDTLDCDATDVITIEARGNFTINVGAQVYNVVSPNVLLNSTVQIANNLRKIKQIDYLKMIMSEFNLMLSVDGSVATLECWDDFFNGVVNWTSRLVNSPKVGYVSDEVPNEFRFTYNESDDYHITEFNKLHPEPDFGNGTFETGNDFKQSAEAVETDHAATKIAKSFINGTSYLNLPSVIKAETPDLDADIEPRLLINAGNVSVPTLSDGTYASVMVNSVSRTEIPLFYFLKPVYGNALVPDTNPDVYDINLAFEFPEGEWNGTGLIDKFFKGRLRNYQDLRIVEAEFILTSQDIAALDFRKMIYIEHPGFTGNYILQEIENFNPLSHEATKVTLLKVQ